MTSWWRRAERHDDGMALTMRYVQHAKLFHLSYNTQLDPDMTVEERHKREREMQEKHNAAQELTSLEHCIRQRLIVVGGGSVLTTFLAYKVLIRRFAPRRFTPALSSLGLGLLTFTLSGRLLFDPCKYEFLRRTPKEQYPLAAKARAILRNQCPDHPALKDIPDDGAPVPEDVKWVEK